MKTKSGDNFATDVELPTARSQSNGEAKAIKAAGSSSNMGGKGTAFVDEEDDAPNIRTS